MKPSRRLLAGAIVVLFVGFHLALLPQSLEDVDSINLALGLRDFDVGRHQPHPPGNPVLIAAGRALLFLVPTELQALSVLSGLAGGFAIIAMLGLFVALQDKNDRFVTWTGTVLVATCPLFWLSAARPLSDMAGLAAALAVQCLILRSHDARSIGVAAALAAAATGIRSQVAWLTLPLLARGLLLLPPPNRARPTVVAFFGVLAGALVWLVPVVVDSGGLGAYWRVLAAQGGEDLDSGAMLAASFTLRHLVASLQHIFVAPWASGALSGLVLLTACLGLIRVAGRVSSGLPALLTAFGPYFLFCLWFQETATTRYALPLVVPLGYLAARGLLMIPPAARALVGAAILLPALVVDATVLGAYSSAEAPAFRMLGDMAGAATANPAVPLKPVLAMHRRNELAMRRPIKWMGQRMPPLELELGARAKHEWLELVQYWNAGGRSQVWFVADPLRSDLALVGTDRRPRQYRWPFDPTYLLGGVRPSGMDWYRIDPPDWYLGEGWSLTPETAGVAVEDRRGPGYGAISAWVRRWPGTVNLLIGGRNLAPNGAPAEMQVAIDGKPIDTLAVQPGFFVRIWSVDLGHGAGDYATVRIASSSKHLAIEQFDAQPDNRLVFGFGEGWHEQEFNPSTGALWRWSSDRAVIHVRSPHQAATLSIGGELEAAATSHIRVRAGERDIAAFDVGKVFTKTAVIPAEALSGPQPTITIETSAWYVPAETRRRSADRRRLGLKLREVRLSSAS